VAYPVVVLICWMDWCLAIWTGNWYVVFLDMGIPIILGHRLFTIGAI